MVGLFLLSNATSYRHTRPGHTLAYLNELAAGVLSPALLWYIDDSTFQQLQQTCEKALSSNAHMA